LFVAPPKAVHVKSPMMVTTRLLAVCSVRVIVAAFRPAPPNAPVYPVQSASELANVVRLDSSGSGA
jgi:hypothetical protein